MNFRLVFAFLLATLLLTGAGSVLAADSADADRDGELVVSQLTDMKGAGAASDSSDYTDFADDEYADTKTLINDPLVVWNKIWFYFNDAMFHGVLKPVATGYAWVVPSKPRQWVRNFFINMLFPVRFVNNILQGKFDAAYMEFSKFIANTSFGLLGFVDVTADKKKLWLPERPTADGFGQTLGKAQVGHGIYLVWPFLGPSSVRETVGWVGDYFLDPLTYCDLTFLEMAGIKAYKNVNSISLELQTNEYEAITSGAIDKYAAVRDAYIRFRAKKVQE